MRPVRVVARDEVWACGARHWSLRRLVMAGTGHPAGDPVLPPIHVFIGSIEKAVDARHEAGRDGPLTIKHLRGTFIHWSGASTVITIAATAFDLSMLPAPRAFRPALLTHYKS